MATRLPSAALWLLADGALAHPGHGVAPAASWLHGLEPIHLAPAFAVLLAAAFALRRRRAARERNR